MFYVKNFHVKRLKTWEAVFFPAHLRHVGPASLQHRFSLMWERKEAKSFDVTTGHAPYLYALNYSWGEHWEGLGTRLLNSQVILQLLDAMASPNIKLKMTRKPSNLAVAKGIKLMITSY